MAFGGLENTDKLYYVKGQGYFSTQPTTWTDKLGQQHSQSGGIVDSNGNLKGGSMLTTDGTRVTWGQPKLRSSRGGSANASSSDDSSGYSGLDAESLIADWKAGRALTEKQRDIVRQYLMRQGYYTDDADEATVNRALAQFVSGKQSSNYSSGGGRSGGGGVTYSYASTEDPDEEKERDAKNAAAKAERKRLAHLRNLNRELGIDKISF